MAHIQWETMSTSFASCSQCLFLGIDFDVRLRVVAILAQDEFTNKSVQHVLQFRSIMGSVYDVTIILEIKLGLSSQFTSKVFCWIWKKMRKCTLQFSPIFLELKKVWYDFSFGKRSQLGSWVHYPKEIYLQVGGLPRALAISTMLGMTVLTPFPLPSTLACNRGILYL